MGEVVNLRLARKQAARARDEQEAAAMRALHGRSRAEKERDRREADRAAASLDQHRREREAGGEA